MKRPFFVIKEGDTPGLRVNLWHGCIFGRAIESDIVVPDRRASRHHARIDFRPDGVWLVDLNSANKTYVNGLSIAEKKLDAGDMVRIASSMYVFQEEDDTPSLNLGEDLKDSQAICLSPESDKTTFQEARSLRDVDNVEGLVKLAQDPRSDRVINILMNIFELSKKLNTIHDINRLLDELMQLIFKTFPSAERGFIMLAEPGKDKLQIKTAKTRTGDTRVMASQTVVNAAIDRREAMLSQNTMEDEELKFGESIITHGITSVMAVPMIRYTGGEEELLGLIYLDSRKLDKPFDKIDLSIISALAGQAAVAIKNAQLIEEIKLSTQLRTSLERYLSPDVVEQVINKQIDINLGGNLKKGAVMFSDLTGFTTLSEKMDPATLVGMLNLYFNKMVDIVFGNYGTIDKFGGDSLLAVWGAPKETPDAAFLALRTAVEMQNALFTLNVEQKWPYFLKIGVGITHGKFLAGNIGSQQRMEYTVIGHTVNLAQRLESLAPSDAVMLNSEAIAELRTPAAVITFEPIPIKGMSKPITVHSVRGYLECAKPFRVILSIPVHIMTDSARKIRGRIVGFFRDRFNREFVSVLHETSLNPDRSFILVPRIPELPAAGTVAAYQVENDTSSHSIGGSLRGTQLRVDVEKSDPLMMRLMRCDQKITTKVCLSTLKDDERATLSV